MIYVTRKMHFSASHRLYNPTFEPEKNNLIFDKCNNLNGHGHNYTLEVTVKGFSGAAKTAIEAAGGKAIVG